ncbi:MAG: hypothetical protein H0T15_09715 [Thermoleophilaceae bacterium]|nr:hypothetical protein [Thermoleophilaceae bacterium]
MKAATASSAKGEEARQLCLQSNATFRKVFDVANLGVRRFGRGDASGGNRAFAQARKLDRETARLTKRAKAIFRGLGVPD